MPSMEIWLCYIAEILKTNMINNMCIMHQFLQKVCAGTYVYVTEGLKKRAYKRLTIGDGFCNFMWLFYLPIFLHKIQNLLLKDKFTASKNLFLFQIYIFITINAVILFLSKFR